MKSETQITDCVEFKNELHRKLFIKSGARDFNEYIKYINSIYSDNRKSTVVTESSGDGFIVHQAASAFCAEKHG